jgi:hypothetical protein
VNQGTPSGGEVSPCFSATLVNAPVYNSTSKTTTFTYRVCGKNGATCSSGLSHVSFITGGTSNIVVSPKSGSTYKTSNYSYTVTVPVSSDKNGTIWGIKYDVVTRGQQQGIKTPGECDNFTFTLSGARTVADITAIEFKAGEQVTRQTTTGCQTSASIATAKGDALTEEPVTLRVSAYPNPYTDKVKFVIQSPVSGKATLEVFNMLGQKIQNVYQGHVTVGIAQPVEYNVPNANRHNLMYILRVGDQKISGKLIH